MRPPKHRSAINLTALFVCGVAAILVFIQYDQPHLRLLGVMLFVASVFLYGWDKQQKRLLEKEDAEQQLHEEKGELAERLDVLEARIKPTATMLDMAPYPVWRRDREGKIVFANFAYLEAVEDIMEPPDVPEMDQAIAQMAKQAWENGEPVTERRYIIVAGERKLFQITETPVPEQQMTIGFAVDMDDLDRLQKDVERHVEAQNDLLESTASAMAIYGSDMRLKSFNNAFVSLWKLDETWLDTQPNYGEVLEILRDRRALPEQANFQLFKQQQLKLFTDLIDPQEEFFYLPDGKALRVIAIPHALGGILFAYEDVTDRLALERSYNTLIAVQRETLDHLHEAVAVFGEDGRLRLFNPGFLELWDVDSDVARSEPHVSDIVERCKHFFVFEEWESFKKKHVDDIIGRNVRSKHIERRDGKVIDWRKIPLPDGAILLTYLDITDSTLVERSLRERNEALQEADKLKTEFLANVSYELRSPLTSIIGFSEMLGQEYFGPLSEKQREYIENIGQSSTRLMQLINDILDLASVEAGYMRLEVAQCDIRKMMKSVLSLIQERAKKLDVNVEFICPPRFGKMTGDETRIKQILFNLLSNALSYSSKGDTITFGVEKRDEERIMMWVQDEGPGIAPEEQEAIFGKFYKGKAPEGPKETGADRAGTGLGLSIVKSFMELHGGTVELQSDTGTGARFECTFLRDNPNLIPAAPEQKKA